MAVPALNPPPAPRDQLVPRHISTGKRAGPLELWHLTSLDAPTVAVSWTLAFASAAGIDLRWPPVAAIALAAWSVYILDRILDARCGLNSTVPDSLGPGPCSLRPRHLFHWRHRHTFLPLALISAITALGLFDQSMLASARPRNALLALAALAYLAAVHNPWHPILPRLRLPKELLVGILFTLACAAPTWARTSAAQHTRLILPLLFFITLAWLNCHAIEVLESAHSIRRVVWPAWALSAIAVLAATANFPQHRAAALLWCAALSSAALALLPRFRARLLPTTLRAAADLVLLTPLTIVLFPF